MKSFSKVLTSGLVGIALFATTMLAMAGQKVGATQVPYVSGGTPTITTPRFNMYSEVPGIGDESDFVRLRTSNGDPTASAVANVYVDPVNSDCKVGDMYDVRSYVHNGADPEHNNNGAGTAVAHEVAVSLTAPLNTTGTNFTFGSTISAKSVDSVSDTGTLHCAGNVQLQLVPSKVYVYSKVLGWVNASDAAVNGSLVIGSNESGSGDVWACWDSRVMVVYTVKVVAVPVIPVYSCDLLTNTGKISDNKYGFKVDYTAKNGAVFNNVTYVYSDKTTTTDGAVTSHLFTDKTVTKKKVTATVNFTVNGESKSNTSAKCATEFDVKIPVTPPTLPDTGAGSTVAIFVATTFVGAFLYRMRALRSLR